MSTRRKLAKVIDMFEWRLRATLRELEATRAVAEAAQAELAEAEASGHRRTCNPDASPCAYCLRFAADLPPRGNRLAAMEKGDGE